MAIVISGCRTMLISVLNAAINWLKLDRERNNPEVKRPQALFFGAASLPAFPEFLPIMQKAGCAPLSRPTALKDDLELRD